MLTQRHNGVAVALNVGVFGVNENGGGVSNLMATAIGSLAKAAACRNQRNMHGIRRSVA